MKKKPTCFDFWGFLFLGKFNIVFKKNQKKFEKKLINNTCIKQVHVKIGAHIFFYCVLLI